MVQTHMTLDISFAADFPAGLVRLMRLLGCATPRHALPRRVAVMSSALRHAMLP